MLIEFPDGYQMDPDREVYKFVAQADGNRLVCLVSVEALQDNFHVIDEPDVGSSFVANKAILDSIAEDKIRRGAVEQNNEVHIRNVDIRQHLR